MICLIVKSENVNSMSDIYDLNGNSKKTTVIWLSVFLSQFSGLNIQDIVKKEFLERRELTIKQGEWNIGRYEKIGFRDKFAIN